MSLKAMLGKKVLNHVYWHYSLTPEQDVYVQNKITLAEELANLVAGEDYNVVKFNVNSDALSLMLYPNFFDDPFPALAKSWRINLTIRQFQLRQYLRSTNPPILHRK